MKNQPYHSYLPGLVFVSVLLAACSPSGPKPAAELVIGVGQDYRATDVFSHKGFNCLVFQTLVKLDAKGGLQPLVAESWDVGADGKSYTFHLNKDAVFSDGTPVTARQVKESMFYKQTRQRKRGPSRWEGGKGEGGKEGRGGPPRRDGESGRPSEGASGRPSDNDEKLNREFGSFDNERYNLPKWSPFQSIDVIDDHTIRFNLDRPYTLFLNELSTTHSYPVLKIDDSEEVTGYIGTGPYKIDEQVRTQYMILTRNEHFWQGEVKIPRIRLKVIPDPETRAISLEAGEIQLTGYDHFDKVPNESVTRLKEVPSVTIGRAESLDHPSVSYIALNYKKAPFTDINVREAIVLAIDQHAIDVIMSETGRTLPGPFPEDFMLYTPNITPNRYDPAEAKRLLSQAGWSDSNGDGILDKDGRPFSIKLTFSAFDPQYKTVAEIVQAQLKAVGIELKLEMMELGGHITTMRSADYDLTFWSMMRYHMFYYTLHPSWLNVYNSTELDDAFTRYLHVHDEAVNREAVEETQRLITASHVFPLFFERYCVVAWNHDRLRNFQPLPLGWDLSMELWKADFKPE